MPIIMGRIGPIAVFTALSIVVFYVNAQAAHAGTSITVSACSGKPVISWNLAPGTPDTRYEVQMWDREGLSWNPVSESTDQNIGSTDEMKRVDTEDSGFKVEGGKLYRVACVPVGCQASKVVWSQIMACPSDRTAANLEKASERIVVTDANGNEKGYRTSRDNPGLIMGQHNVNLLMREIARIEDFYSEENAMQKPRSVTREEATFNDILAINIYYLYEAERLQYEPDITGTLMD